MVARAVIGPTLGLPAGVGYRSLQLALAVGDWNNYDAERSLGARIQLRLRRCRARAQREHRAEHAPEPQRPKRPTITIRRASIPVFSLGSASRVSRWPRRRCRRDRHRAIGHAPSLPVVLSFAGGPQDVRREAMRCSGNGAPTTGSAAQPRKSVTKPRSSAWLWAFTVTDSGSTAAPVIRPRRSGRAGPTPA